MAWFVVRSGTMTVSPHGRGHSGWKTHFCYIFGPILTSCGREIRREAAGIPKPRSSFRCQADEAGSTKETDDACDGVREGYRRQRKGLSPHARDGMMEAMGRFNDELAKAGIMLAGRRPQALLEGQACRVRWSRPHGHRRAVRRNPRTGRRLLALGSQGHGRGGRLGEALPQSHAGTERDRNPAAVRDGRSARVSDAPEAKQIHDRTREKHPGSPLPCGRRCGRPTLGQAAKKPDCGKTTE